MIKLFQKQSILKLLLFIFLTFTTPAYSTINAYATTTGTEKNEGKTLTFNIDKDTIKSENNAGTGAADEFERFLTDENGFMTIVSQAGLVLVAFGIGQIVLAFKDDNPAEKSKGVMILLGGVFCVTIKIVLKQLGIVF